MKIVVVGHGMVGARFIDEVLARDRAQALAQLSITVLGAEPYPPYNRVLLSDVIAGRCDLAGISLATRASSDVACLSGRTACRVDRRQRLVVDDLGEQHRYDHLVFATGAAATRPVLPGLDEVASGAHTVRDLDDARDLLAACSNAHRVAVIGAGVLGIELATGLAGRGLQVLLLGRGRLMDRQLDVDAAASVQVALSQVGVAVRHSNELAVQSISGRVNALRLDGESVPVDLIVFATGTRPRTELAAAAGLRVDHGIVVDETLTCSDDPRVHAIGDCAQPPDGASGLIAQGWDQARRLSNLLTSAEQRLVERVPVPATLDTVVKVKSERVQVVSMGVHPADRQPDDRRLRLLDPDAGRHVEVLIRADTLIGAAVIGDPGLAADLTTRFTRGTPLPPDPAQLLIKPPAEQAKPARSSLTRLPDRAAICRCNGVSKADIVRSWHQGARTVEAVSACTRAATGCGTCSETIADLLAWVEESSGDLDHTRLPDRPSATCSKHAAPEPVTETP